MMDDDILEEEENCAAHATAFVVTAILSGEFDHERVELHGDDAWKLVPMIREGAGESAWVCVEHEVEYQLFLVRKPASPKARQTIALDRALDEREAPPDPNAN